MSYLRTVRSGFMKVAARCGLAAVLSLLFALLLVGIAGAAEITKLVPKEIHQNGSVRIVIDGSGLGEAAGVDFGPGINVDRMSVESDIRIAVFLTADEDAEIGVRDISVILPEGKVTLEGQFTVLKRGTMFDLMCASSSLRPVSVRELTVGWSIIGLVFSGSLFATRFVCRRMK